MKKNLNRRLQLMKVAAEVMDAGGGYKAVTHGATLLPYLNKLVADTIEYNSRPTTLASFIEKKASQICVPSRKQILASALHRIVR